MPITRTNRAIWIKEILAAKDSAASEIRFYEQNRNSYQDLRYCKGRMGEWSDLYRMIWYELDAMHKALFSDVWEGEYDH